MAKIKYNTIIFIVKMLLMILLNLFSGFITVIFNMQFVFLILFIVYLYHNLHTLLICFTKENVLFLKNTDRIVLIILTIILIASCAFIFMVMDYNSVKTDEHGAIFMFSLIALGLSVLYFLIAYFIDKAVSKKISGEQ